MVVSGVSKPLFSHIQNLMGMDCLSEFNLGGGTSLAIKHNHRISTDIDLFSQGVVGAKNMSDIAGNIQAKLKPSFIKVLNENLDNLCFIRAILQPDETKVEIIQNIKNILPSEAANGIRLIHDDDIGALKLLSAAGRGVQKDFYDLYLLTEIKPLPYYYDHLLRYYEENSNAPSNLFDNIGAMGPNRGFDLTKDLSPLCDFNHAGDKKNASNRILFTENSPINIPWPVLREKWKTRVIQLAKERGLRFRETPVRRTPKFPWVRPG